MIPWPTLLIAVSGFMPVEIIGQFDTPAHCEKVRAVMAERRPMPVWICAEGMQPAPGK